MKIVAVVQARLNSQRLPGKVLMPLAGIPMVWRVLQRVLAVQGVDKVYLAIPHGDIALRDVFYEYQYLDPTYKCQLFAGERDNVASRFLKIIRIEEPYAVIRVTADCPFFDPLAAELMIQEIMFMKNTCRHWTYMSNTHPGVDGLDCELFNPIAFAKHHQEVSGYKYDGLRMYLQEHVTIGLRNGMDGKLKKHLDYYVDHAHLKLSVDTKEEYEHAVKMYPYVQEKENFSFLHTFRAWKLVETLKEIGGQGE